jgi:hypothetical protein
MCVVWKGVLKGIEDKQAYRQLNEIILESDTCQEGNKNKLDSE